MFLYFSLSASDGSLTGPCVCCAEFEIQMEVLSSFVALGNVLLSAYVIDDDGFRIDLPVEAFDGLPVANCVKILTSEYQQLLSA
ncbi:hypothetical protein [Larkinella ripae]